MNQNMHFHTTSARTLFNSCPQAVCDELYLITSKASGLLHTLHKLNFKIAQQNVLCKKSSFLKDTIIVMLCYPDEIYSLSGSLENIVVIKTWINFDRVYCSNEQLKSKISIYPITQAMWF